MCFNLGDSRVVLAQERPNDRHPNPNLRKDDVWHRNKFRESLARMELDRISEECPVHNQNGQVNKIKKKQRDFFMQIKDEGGSAFIRSQYKCGRGVCLIFLSFDLVAVFLFVMKILICIG